MTGEECCCEGVVYLVFTSGCEVWERGGKGREGERERREGGREREREGGGGG